MPLTPLLAAALFGERVTPGGWIATALASVGLFLVAGGSGGPLGANLLVLGGAGCFALHLVLTARVARAHEPRLLALVQMAVCASAFTIIALTTEPLQPPRELSLWAAILVTGVFASAVGFAVQTWAQRMLTATQTAIAITAEPVSAGLVGFAFAREHLTFVMLLGCVAILLAILAAQTLPTKAT